MQNDMKYSKCYWITKTCVGAVLLVLLIPFLAFVMLFGSLLCGFVGVLLKIKYNKKITRVSGPDSFYGKPMSESLPYINTITRLDGQPILADIIESFNRNVLEATNAKGHKLYGKLTQSFDKRFGYYVWKICENFDIKNHFQLIDINEVIKENDIKELEQESSNNCDINEEHSLNQQIITLTNGKNIHWEAAVNLVMKKFGAVPMNQEFPQWNFTIIVQDCKSFMILFRLHHSISDGINLSRFILEAMLQTKIQVPFSTAKVPLAFRVCKTLMSLCHLPFEIVNQYTTRYNTNLLHGPRLTGKKHYLVSNILSLQGIKEMKKKAKTTVNNILLYGISKTISNYFERKNVDVKSICVVMTSGNQNMNKPVSLRNQFHLQKFNLPISIKPPRIKFSNDNSKSSQNNNIDSSSDILLRLKTVEKCFDAAKMKVGIPSLNRLGHTISYLLPTCLSEFLFTAQGMTLCLSNVPGPQEKISYWGGVQSDLIFWIPDRNPLGFGISVMSYNGRIRFCLSIDEALISKRSEAQLLLNDIEESLLSLKTTLSVTNAFNDPEELLQTI